MNSAPVAVDRGAFALLEDSVVLAMRAEAETDFDVAASLGRSSVLATTLFVEACANTCLDMLALETAFAGDVDRLPTLSKFDLFLRLYRPQRKIDRSRHEVQGVIELKRIRDSFVHPKGQRVIWDSWSPEQSTSRSPRTKATDLPKILSFCGQEDPPRAMIAAHSFLGYFFVELSRFRPSHVSSLLFSEQQVPSLHEKLVPYWKSDRHHWLKMKMINFSYVRIGKL
ncbi:hypothetical protein [Aromatoleum petrolei]|uniref:AbiV family abortive infection protein n=1 Tax=Aromatoleum petrolei TaxID=76116 RepID=A0ABX1MSL8_9RHOO|nr:hypothetical protein [Aromatoleum petrolei]NMF90231.1 hypothetical protein [Aromatoleum petrolei]QTQ35470.1 Uncharacterized protein ToN1_13055 [Aromatoleum petrolei]